MSYPSVVKCFLVVARKKPDGETEWFRPDTGQTGDMFQDFEPGAIGYLSNGFWGNATADELVSENWKQLPEEERAKGTLGIMTPGGFWNIDHVSSKGGGWSRTGVAPNITANPSIFINPPTGYHGWLRDGQLFLC